MKESKKQLGRFMVERDLNVGVQFAYWAIMTNTFINLVSLVDSVFVLGYDICCLDLIYKKFCWCSWKRVTSCIDVGMKQLNWNDYKPRRVRWAQNMPLMLWWAGGFAICKWLVLFGENLFSSRIQLVVFNEMFRKLWFNCCDEGIWSNDWCPSLTHGTCNKIIFKQQAQFCYCKRAVCMSLKWKMKPVNIIHTPKKLEVEAG